MGVEWLAGPDCLGRSVMVTPDKPAPPPWRQAPRIVVRTDNAPDSETGRRLREAWSNRERLVVELHGPLPPPDPISQKQWWELAPDLTLSEEVWHHLLTANTVDARKPGEVSFAPRDQALALGAWDAVDGSPVDIITTDGIAAWCDGGPLTSFDAADLYGASLIPAANLAVGSLASLHYRKPDADLAPDQHKAVGHLGGGACIVAPAGSGKTRVLTERAR